MVAFDLGRLSRAARTCRRTRCRRSRPGG